MIKNIIRFFAFSDYPKQVKYIMWNEGAERYAFYGMRAILVMYMVHYLKMPENISAAIYHYFNAFLYLTPILGAYLSDKYFGKYKIMITFSCIYIVGFTILSAWYSVTGMMIGLFLIALGSGGIKPCVSVFVADQLDKNNSNYEVLRAKAFSMFYFMINFGSLFSTIITPITRENFGPQIAFSIPAILMACSVLLLIAGRKYYVHTEINKKSDSINVFKIIFTALRTKKVNKTDSFLDSVTDKFGKEYVNITFNLLQIIKMFVFIIIFWALFDQQGSSWVLQGDKMDKSLFGFIIAPDLIPSFNPLLVMLLIPIFNRYVYPFIDNKLFKLTPMRKIGLGIFISAASFGSIAIFQYLLDSGVHVHILWQFVSYLLITVAEVLISITGLEFAYSQAPQRMSSLIMSLWLATVFLGNLGVAWVEQINIFSGGNYFMFFTLLTLVLGLLYIPIVKTYKHRATEE